VTIPIHVIPLSINPVEWPVLNRVWDRSTPFRFLLFADSEWGHHRKNFPLALQAFVSAFGNDSSYELNLKLTLLNEELKQVLKSLPSNVKIMRSHLSRDKLLVIMAQSHCFLFPSHGEGFGLPPREAMSTGIPSIFAPFAGLSSISEDVSFHLPWDYEPAFGYDRYAYHWEHGWEIGETNFGKWAGIRLDDLIQTMRFAAGDRRRTRLKGWKAAKWIRLQYSLSSMSRQIASLFTPLLIPTFQTQEEAKADRKR